MQLEDQNFPEGVGMKVFSIGYKIDPLQAETGLPWHRFAASFTFNAIFQPQAVGTGGMHYLHYIH